MGSNPGLNRIIGLARSGLSSPRARTRTERLAVDVSIAFVLALCTLAGRAVAQQATIDNSVPTFPGSGASLLGTPPGSGVGLFPNLPGTGGILGGRAGVSTPKGIPTEVSRRVLARAGRHADADLVTSAATVSPTTTPFYGTLEIPTEDDDGPPNGVTLEQAISITLDRSLELRSKFLEIPMAAPTFSRPTCGPTPFSTRTASSSSTRARARRSRVRHRAVPASSTPT